MLEWSEKFETGHSIIDTQHRMLISYINRLEELAQNTNPTRDDIELFFRFVDFLGDYILMHFRGEEDRMLRFHCPAHKENKQAHTEFIDFYHGFVRRLKNEQCRPDLINELYEGCSRWVKIHILRIDTQMKPCQSECRKHDEPA